MFPGHLFLDPPRLSSYVYAVFTSLQIENKEGQFQTKRKKAKRQSLCVLCSYRPAPGSSARSGCGARLGSGLRGSGLRGRKTPPAPASPLPGLGGDLDRGARLRARGPRRGARRSTSSAATGEAEWARPWLAPAPPLRPAARGSLYARGPGSQVPAAGFLSDPLPPGAGQEAFPNSAFPASWGVVRITMAMADNQIFIRFPEPSQ